MNQASPVRPALLKEVLIQAAAIVTKLYNSGTMVTRKTDGSPLTHADTHVDKFLHSTLKKLLPSAAWLSEETADEPTRLTYDWVWIVDPLDGTKEFARGTPEFAISIGLVYRHIAVLGGIINPVTNEGGVGSLDGDIQFWGMPNGVTAAADLIRTTASVSRTEFEDGTLLSYLPLVGTVRPVGSVAYKLLRAAAGVDDLTFTVRPKSEWDICGGVALLGGVNKVYRRFDHEPVLFNRRDISIRCGAVAGGETLVSQFMVEVVRQGLSRRTTG